MKRIRPFRYFEVGTVSEAVGVLAREGVGAYRLAGGTDLLVRMKRGDLAPGALVNLKRIAGLDGIAKESGGLRIGALATIGAVERSSVVRASHPVLVEAAGLLGSPSIRNLGTLGGNMGRASPASDMAPSLIVLRGRVCIEGVEGKREVAVEEFFKGPGETVLSSGEMITAVYVPEMAEGSGAAYLKMGRREGMDCALVGVAGYLALGGRGREVREVGLAVAACAPVPLRVKRAEEVLRSGGLTEARLKEAARVVAEEVTPISDMRGSGWYRREVAGVLAYRVLERAWKLAEGDGGGR